MRKLLAVMVAAGALVAGCNIKVPPSQPCPSGYHRLSGWEHRPEAYCGPDKS